MYRKDYIGGTKMDSYLDSDHFLGGFLFLTVLSGFLGNNPLLSQRQTNPAGLGAVNMRAMGWTLVVKVIWRERQCTQRQCEVAFCPAI